MKTQITIPCVGYEIVADLYIETDAKGFLLVIVGLNSTKERNTRLVETILEGVNQNALVLDLSGHGESQFSLADISPAQHLSEVVHAFDWLRDNYSSDEITVMGTSYGGYLASHLAQYRSFSKLLLRTPAPYRPEDFFTNHQDIDILQTATVYRKNITELAMNPVFIGKKIFAGRTLIVVHDADDFVPSQATDKYIATFNAESYIAHTFKHSFNDPGNPKDMIKPYVDRLVDFIAL